MNRIFKLKIYTVQYISSMGISTVVVVALLSSVYVHVALNDSF